MSALLEKPIESPKSQVVSRPIGQPRTTRAPQAEVPLRFRVVPRAKQAPRSNVLSLVCCKASLFVGVMAATYLGNSLFGQVQVESARQQRIHAIERAKDARSAEAVLSQQVDRLTSPQGIEAWALAHQFKSPDGLTSTTLIAQK